MKELYAETNPDSNDDTEERREMYVQQSHVFDELIEKWVQPKMPESHIIGLTGGGFFEVAVLLNDSTEFRAPLKFDRKKNLCVDDESNRKAIAEWLRECFKTGQTWAIKNFEVLPDESFIVHDVEVKP
jgi:hypothetical protein